MNCMGGDGFAVPADPFQAPANVMEAEHGRSAATHDLVTRYHTAWHVCVTPYQQTLDRTLFG